jgi:DNA-directed RNA polymerase specialized sigma24 family protein
MNEWRTAAEVLSAKAALVDSMPGWTTPLAYALGIADVSGEIDWRVTNYRNEHELPGVVLGKVLGYRSGSKSYTVDLRTFDEAIAALEPAGACDAFEHPNLWAWQRLRTEISVGEVPPESEIVVAFVGSSPATPDPDDLVQEALARTLRRHRLSDLDAPGAYLRTVVVNVAASEGRRRTSQRRAWTDAVKPAGSVETMPSDLADLERLSPLDRAVLYLVHVEGYPHKEAAELLGISEQASRSRSSRATSQLRRELAAEEAAS